MTAHDPQLVTAHALGILAEAEAGAVERHLRSCADCRAEWSRIRETADLIASVPPEALADGPPPGDLALRRALREVGAAPGPPAGRRRATRSGGHRAPRWAAAAAAVLILTGGGVVAGRLSAPEPAATAVAAQPGARTVAGSHGDVSMTASVAPAEGWVRVAAEVHGIPPGEACTLVVVGADGAAHDAAGWVSGSGRAPGPAPVVGSAVLDPDGVRAVAVVDDDGVTLVETPVIVED